MQGTENIFTHETMLQKQQVCKVGQPASH